MAAGVRPVGIAALEILRIEREAALRRGRDETNVVLEAALDEAVSYTKGCCIGRK